MAKQPICKVCKQPFDRVYSSLQKTCSIQCSIDDVEDRKEKQLQRDIKNAEKAERADRRKAKEKLKSRSQWTKEAQAACNAFIRERDKNEPCISCGRSDSEINGYLTGGKWDAGHFKSRGAYPELRFHALNVHRQCKSCNGGSNKFARKDRVVSSEYKERLIGKIGISMVEWLEGNHKSQNWTVDDLKEIKAHYKQQLKIIKAG